MPLRSSAFRLTALALCLVAIPSREAPAEPAIAFRAPAELDAAVVRAAAQQAGSHLTIPLPGQAPITAVVTDATPVGPGASTAVAHAVDGSTVFIATRDDVVVADIISPDGVVFQIRRNADGELETRLMDHTRFAPCGCGDERDGEPAVRSLRPLVPVDTAVSAARGGDRSGGCPEDGSVIDVLVAYTNSALAGAGSLEDMLALIDLSILETNQALANSGVASTISLAAAVEVTRTWSTTSSSTILDHMRVPDSGTLDELHDLREQHRADLVTLIVNTLDVCGRAYIAVGPGPTPMPELGFNVVSRVCSTAPTYAFAHEIGHNAGLHHDRVSAPCEANGTDFAHGYIEPSETFRTIMAQGTAAPNIPHFSSSTVLYQGQATGDAMSDNATTLGITLPLVARYFDKDRNRNGECDDTDIAMGATDLDGNGVPDEADQDLNHNGVVDAFDISSGASLDTNTNGIPDEAEPARLYVDPAAIGTGLGDAWADARTDLQTALAIADRSAGAVTEVWVAAGIYTPAPAPRRAVPFQLVNGCTIYGGFAGTEASLTERDWRANPSILSGDLLQDDAGSFVNTGDNSTSVVWASYTDDTAAIDGFFIEAGNCSYDTSDCSFTPYTGGGGIRCFAGDATIRNCVIRDSSANNGGGAFVIHTGTPDFIGCDFINNRAVGPDSETGAGALRLSANDNGEFCNVERCRFFGNVAPSGGAVTNICQNGLFLNCLFVGNRATAFRGGAISNSGSCGSSPDIINCTFVHNFGNWGGAAVSNGGCSEPLVANSVFWGNESDSTMNGGIRSLYTTFQDNNFTECPSTFFNSYVQAWQDYLPGVNTDGTDPMFMDIDGPDDILGNLDDDLRLAPGSPAIDSGDNALLPIGADLDLAMNPRRSDDPDTVDTGLPAADAPYVDRGAFEVFVPSLCPADIDGDGDTDVFDFADLAEAFGTCSGDASFAAPADLTDDGCVDVFDFAALAENFGCGQ